MKTYTLNIKGNLTDPNGNPIPYTRMTKGTLGRDSAQRYLAWQQWIRAKFYDKYKIINLKKGKVCAPIDSGKNDVHVSMYVTYKDDTHGDLDNIVKGMLDSLLVNDKYVCKILALVGKNVSIGSVDCILEVYD